MQEMVQLRLLAGTNVQIWNSDATSLAANFNGDTQTSLYYAGAAKLATTNTGIDVTGSVTADGLTVQMVHLKYAQLLMQL